MTAQPSSTRAIAAALGLEEHVLRLEIKTKRTGWAQIVGQVQASDRDAQTKTLGPTSGHPRGAHLEVAVDDARAGVQEVQPVAELAAERLPPGPVQRLEPAVGLPARERA